jgi:hypothetical protein
VASEWKPFNYLNGSLHYHICGVVDALGAELQDGRVSLFFGLVDVFVDVLKRDEIFIIARQRHLVAFLTCSLRISIGWTNFL